MQKKSLFFRYLLFTLPVICLSFQPLAANEKLILGIKGNIGATNSTGQVISTDLTWHYNVGAQLCYNVVPLLGIETGLQVNQSGYGSEFTFTNELGQTLGTSLISYRYSYLVIPLYLRLQLKGLYVAGGINAGVNTGTSEHVSSDYPFETIPDSEFGDTESFSTELHLGLGYRAMLFHRAGIFVELGYNRQLSGLYENFSDFKLFNVSLGGGVCVSLIND